MSSESHERAWITRKRRYGQSGRAGSFNKESAPTLSLFDSKPKTIIGAREAREHLWRGIELIQKQQTDAGLDELMAAYKILKGDADGRSN